MFKTVFLISLLTLCNVVSAGEKYPMKVIMDHCIAAYEKQNPNERDFSVIVRCIKKVYTDSGTSPNSPNVKTFYTFADEIEERFISRELSYIRSKAELVRAWQSTIEAGNVREQQQQHQQNLENQRIENLQRMQNQQRSDQLLDAYRRGEFNSNCIPSAANNYTCR